MPLTPADVHNVAFKKLPMGKRGYDAEEVDAFLDEVEHELTRLMEENHELRARAGHGSSPGPRLDAELEEVRAQLDQLQRDRAAAEQAAQAMRAELEQVRSRGGPAVDGDGEHHTAGMLMMAQRTADDHLADARREVGKLLADAGAKADEVTREARAAADALERDARQRHQDAVASVDAHRTETLKRIEELQGFLHEYHTRLKAHVESQLRDLDGRGGDLQPS